jgi:hypothetical protein
VVIINECIGLHDGHFNIETREKLTDRSNFEEPVLARLLSMIGNILSAEVI